MIRFRLYEITGIFIIVTLTVLTGISCADNVSSHPAANPPLEGTAWVLKAYGDPADLETPLAEHPVTMTFEKSTRKVSGSTGLNSYGGDYALDGDKVTFTQMIQTLLAGPADVMAQETAFNGVLRSVRTWQIADAELTLTGTAGVLIFQVK